MRRKNRYRRPRHDSAICTYSVRIRPAGTTIVCREVEIQLSIPERLIDDDASVRVLLQSMVRANRCNPHLLSGQPEAMEVVLWELLGRYRQTADEYAAHRKRLSGKQKRIDKGYAEGKA